jgi:ribonuclease HI
MSSQKFYVVWIGRNPGVYRQWADCAEQVNGFSGAKYKSFETEAAARAAYTASWEKHVGVRQPVVWPPEVITNSLVVDAACNGSPGNLEYRGVYLATGEELFHVGPLPNGTNNLGEFLAIVHALALLQRQGQLWPIYSDSRIALSWVKQKQTRSQLPRTDHTEPVWRLVDRAVKWLAENSYPNRLLEWDTEAWGENPADFGRK